MLRFVQWLVSLQWPLRLVGFLFGGFNPWLEENRRDPVPAYRRLRESEPIRRNRFQGTWVLSRYEDVAAVLRDPRFTTDRTRLLPFRLMRRSSRRHPDFVSLLDRNLLMLDGEEHRRVRGLVSKAFTPRRIEALRPRVEAIVDELLGAAAAKGEMELIHDLAHPLPVVVIAELLGVPLEDRERFRGWSSDVVEILDLMSGRDGLRPAWRGAEGLAGYFRGLLAERRRAPKDDLLSAMLAAEEDGVALGEADVLALCALLLAAGHETTTNLIGNAVLALLGHPGERKRLQDDASLMPSAVEEFLRFDSPVQVTDRVITEDLDFRGHRFRRGQLAVCLIGAANHDPARFPDPDRLDVGRGDRGHLAFGLGPHVCLGAPLARLEAEAALAGLLRRFPSFTGPTEPPGRRASVVLRGPTALPLSW
jgi:pimeloyl-[acyl-carrier protein] synthase